MKIDFKDKKIVIPIIIFIGVLALVFLLYKEDENSAIIDDSTEIKTDVGEVSKRESETPVDDKFAAYDNAIKEQRNKYTAINEIESEEIAQFSDNSAYTEEEMQRFEDEKARKQREKMRKDMNSNAGYKPIRTNNSDDEYSSLMQSLKDQQEDRKKIASQPQQETQSSSPYEDMRNQYLFLDSLQKANDPELQSKLDKEERDRKILEAIERKKLSTLKVEKIANSSVFNTIKREEEGTFIKAIIDENITGYAGSRLRIRLLEDIAVGNKILKKNNYLYAIITGFGDQRVKLQIVTIMYENSILPIKLSIYDVDGMEGLYVPSSQFREFTKELGDASVQGVSTNSVDGGDSQNQFFTSIAQRLFQSTSSAISKIIRMNKAKLKYESHIYLVDDTAMEETRKLIYEQNKNKQ